MTTNEFILRTQYLIARKTANTKRMGWSVGDAYGKPIKKTSQNEKIILTIHSLLIAHQLYRYT